jgi:hypothetical protein
MKSSILEAKTYASVFLTHQLTDNGVLENMANICLKPIRKKTVTLLDQHYSINESSPHFKKESLEKAVTCLKVIGLTVTGIGLVGVTLKGLSWLNPKVFKKNKAYVQLKLTEQTKPSGFLSQDLSSLDYSMNHDKNELMPQTIKKLVISYLSTEDLKNLSLVSKSWRTVCTATCIYHRILTDRYSSEWIKSIGIDMLASIPHIQLTAQVTFPIIDPIRGIQLKNMKNFSIVQGIKNQIPFIAIQYISQKSSQKGIVVWYKPPYDLSGNENQDWINASAIQDIDLLGFELVSKSVETEQDAFLSFLQDTMKKLPSSK